MTESIFSWQEDQWQRLWQLHKKQQLPHAFVLSGIPGIGKKQFAKTFANALLCLAPQSGGYPCKQCRPCHLLQSSIHPDLLMITPEEAGQMIKIDQIRSIIDFVNSTSFHNGYRVIIIEPANKMNMNAANALLKSLEEPARDCLFMLITNQSKQLLPTIKSRCQEIRFRKPDLLVAKKWLDRELTIDEKQAMLLLNLAQGAPLKALELAKMNLLETRQNLYQGLILLAQKKMSPLLFSTQFQEVNLVVMLHLLQIWLNDLLRLRLIHGESDLINIDFHADYVQLVQQFSLKNIICYTELIQRIQANLNESANLNRQLILEELFISWVKYVSC